MRSALVRIETEFRRGGERRRVLSDLSALLKRVALAAYPRGEVASLSGASWVSFLDRTLGGTEFSGGPGRVLGFVSYDGRILDEVGESEVESILMLCGKWIRTHHREGDGC